MAREFLCSKTEPVVKTKAGKLRGFQCDGTYTFHGIKYADAKRFQPPEEVKPWEGVKDALSYGYVCPLLRIDRPSGELMVPHRYWPFDENCQYLNIWTQSLEQAAKKPVMVWLHGGGFSAGSSIEQQAYDGANLSKYGDVVVVSLNHRLNILGYFDLSPFGEKYSNSGNAGNVDMVMALRWIRDNIENFGGDPENVTLFGQSGGGMKVWTLMQTPEADGLFHKGIVQSGVIENDVLNMEKQGGTEVVKAVLNELGLTENDVEKLETVDYRDLAEAYNKVVPALEKQGLYVGCAPMANDFYLGDPRTVGFTEHAKTIPVMVGTVLGEFAFGPALSKEQKADKNLIEKMVKEKYGAAGEELLALFAKAYPGKNSADLLFLDTLFRAPSKEFVEKKAAHTQSGTYSYLFTYEFPYDDGHVAWHCSEIPFVFKNCCLIPVCGEEGVTEKLETQVCSAWVAFARNGDPNCSALPQWPACKSGDEATMIFDTSCEVRHNHDNELIDLLKKAAPPFHFGNPEEPIQH